MDRTILILSMLFWRDAELQVLQEDTAIVAEGSPAEMHCAYNITSTNRPVFWYKQLARQEPKLLVGGLTRTEKYKHFVLTIDEKERSSTLGTKSAEVEDSGVYLCAISSTVQTTQPAAVQ